MDTKNSSAKGSNNEKRKTGSRSAKEAAYTYISGRMHTAYEVNTYLSGKGYGSEEILEAINDLTGSGYLNDYEYAVRYFEHNREKKRGSLRGARELAERGVDRETIKNAREDFLYENNVDEFADAADLAERLSEGSVNEKQIASLARKLETRGFGHDAIYGVIERMRSRISGDPEDEDL